MLNETTNDVSKSALDKRAQRAAKRVGLMAVRGRWRRDSIDNLGGFQIVDPIINGIAAGVRFDMSAEDVIAYCTEE